MIDDVGLKILKILQEKARIPNVEVARQVGIREFLLKPANILELAKAIHRVLDFGEE